MLEEVIDKLISKFLIPGISPRLDTTVNLPMNVFCLEELFESFLPPIDKFRIYPQFPHAQLLDYILIQW
jgi:hypothetical protein